MGGQYAEMAAMIRHTLAVQFNGEALRFATPIGPAERSLSGLIDEEDAANPVTHVVLNPARPSARSLLERLERSQKQLLPREKIAIGHGLHRSYDKKWKAVESAAFEENERAVEEGQNLVLVAFDLKRKPVGYFGLRISSAEGSQPPLCDLPVTLVALRVFLFARA